MPLYEFQHCGGRFERMLPMAAARETACPGCGDPATPVVTAPLLRGAPGLGARSLPTALNELGGGRETLKSWRKQAERVSAFEARNPETAPPRRPVISHEGASPRYGTAR
jgi:putative FmdB family regulatory protein